MAEVVDLKQEQITWAPVDTTSVITTGQIVSCGSDAVNSGDGVQSMTAAAGATDTTGKIIPFGVVTGVNDVNQTLNADGSIDTGAGEVSITGIETQAGMASRNYFGQEGMWSKGDRQVLVEVATIDVTTKIKLQCYDGTFGTAPRLLTSTTVSTTGLGFTTNAINFTPIADRQTFYCRTGENAGTYRISETTSTTVHTFQIPWAQDVAIGDTFIAVPVTFGYTRFQTDALASYCDSTATPIADYYAGTALELNFAEAGKEYIVVKFSPEHFNPVRT